MNKNKFQSHSESDQHRNSEYESEEDEHGSQDLQRVKDVKKIDGQDGHLLSSTSEEVIIIEEDEEEDDTPRSS